MKLVKKIISSICALGMVATTVPSILVHAEAELPQIVLEQTSYDESTKEGTLTLSFKGLKEYVSSYVSNFDYYQVGTIQAEAVVDTTKLDASLYQTTGSGRQQVKNIEKNMVFNPTFLCAAKSNCAWVEDSKTVKFAVGVSNLDQNAICTYNGTDLSDFEIYKLNFKLKDGVDSADFSVSAFLLEGALLNSDFNGEEKVESFGFNKIADNTISGATVTLGKAAPTTYAVTTADAENGTVTVDKATAAEGETVKITATPDDGYEVDTVAVEAADGTSVAVSDNSFVMPAQAVTVKATFKEIPVVDPTAATKLGTYHDGDKDNAVAFTKTFDSAALKDKKTMKLTAVIGGKDYAYKNGSPIEIPNVDNGDLTVGVVIQYGDSAVNVESLAIELQ